MTTMTAPTTPARQRQAARRRHLMCPPTHFDVATIARLPDAFTPVAVDLSELLCAGGGPKCCTMELRA